MTAIFRKGDSIEAFYEAKQNGLVRFIGVTGHHDPTILKQCMELFDFDTVLLPVNPAEPGYNSFVENVVPTLRNKGMGIIGMKVYFRVLATQLPWYKSMKPFLYYALSQPISTVLIGCANLSQLEENVAMAAMFHPLTVEELNNLTNNVNPFAR